MSLIFTPEQMAFRAGLRHRIYPGAPGSSLL
jgi:hypothetical protein